MDGTKSKDRALVTGAWVLSLLLCALLILQDKQPPWLMLVPCPLALFFAVALKTVRSP